MALPLRVNNDVSEMLTPYGNKVVLGMIVIVCLHNSKYLNLKM